MRQVKSLFLCGAIFFLVSCAMNTGQLPSDATNVPSPATNTEQELLPISTTTTTPLPSATPSVVSTATSLPAQEVIALPTISPDALHSFVLDLTDDSQNCLLPCFWNIVPGETEWRNIEPFLATFAYRISYGAADGTFSDIPVGNSFIAWMYVYLPDLSNAPFSYTFNVRDGIVTMIDAAILTVPINSLPAILNEYGQPTEIWVLTANAPMDDVLGFRLTLFYSPNQFLLSYGGDGEVANGKVRGCLSDKEESLDLVTWSPEAELTFADAIYGLSNPRQITYDLPLEEATGMRVETFYETFKHANELFCLETPVELWPSP